MPTEIDVADATSGGVEFDLAAAMLSPKRMRTDEGTVEERTIHELVTGDRYIAAKAATRAPWGMRIARARPMGTVD